mmetsp:Transcript_10884/g.16207  ORF Transcript_10884/g.16207 Transcript_10884/m.16207 type:complete len:275 (-) Transcript_10884:1317-2141(-)
MKTIITTRPSLLTYLLLFQCTILKRAYSIGCSSDPSIPGFETLKELFDFSVLEFQAVQSGQPIREPPYIYFLCPDTIYKPDEEGYYILPLLDETYYFCGSDGSSKNNCIIDGGFTQAQITPSHVEGYVKHITGFFGIMFQGSNFVSIRAESSNEEMTSFSDCHWTGNTGFATAWSLYAPPPTPSTNATVNSVDTVTNGTDRSRFLFNENDIISMSLVFTDCTFSNAYYNESSEFPDFYGIVNVRGKLILDGCGVYNNSGRVSFFLFPFLVWAHI